MRRRVHNNSHAISRRGCRTQCLSGGGRINCTFYGHFLWKAVYSKAKHDETFLSRFQPNLPPLPPRFPYKLPYGWFAFSFHLGHRRTQYGLPTQNAGVYCLSSCKNGCRFQASWGLHIPPTHWKGFCLVTQSEIPAVFAAHFHNWPVGIEPIQHDHYWKTRKRFF